MTTAEIHVLVTGGLGFIGSRVAEILCRRGIRTTVVDNLWSNGVTLGSKEQAELDRRRQRLVEAGLAGAAPMVHEIDLTNAAAVGAMVAEAPPTHVVHLAGLSRADLSYSNSALALGPNLLATHQLLDALAKQPAVRRVLFASSSMVYGHFEEPVAAEAPAPRRDDGSCFECGDGLCPQGFYCDRGASGGPACSWLPDCAKKPTCACLVRALGKSCSCEDSSGGPTVSCE